MVSSDKGPTNNETLILGYGNLDRQDDGIAWHVLTSVWQSLGLGQAPDPDLGFHPNPVQPSPHFLFDLQLSPEMAETISAYDRVLFIDAHTGQVPEEINIVNVQGDFQTSPFTHHMTPSTLLSLCESLYNKHPHAILVSIRGYEFGFDHSLSDRSAALVKRATVYVLEWLRGNTSPVHG